MRRFAYAFRTAIMLALTFAAPTLQATLPRGVSGDRAADRIFGKPDFSEINPYTTVAGKLWLPHGVVVDRTSPSANKLYIYDAGNNRILGFDLNTCRSSPTDPLGCTAAIVIGQPNMSTSACNGDSGFQNYPLRAPASASSLCGLPEDALSIGESGSGASMAVDAAGNLYVADFWNHRVLKYDDPFNTDGVADDFWGQTDYSSNDCNKGMSSPDATSLCFSWGDSNNWTAGVDVDASGNLWVVDSGNNRVLRFPSGSKTADLVLGQPGFTSSDPGTALDQMGDPSAVRVSPTTGWAYVSESGNDRVLVYKPPFINGMAGSLFGSGFWAPQGVDFDPTEPGSVWVANLNHTTLELWSESTGTKIREVGSLDNGNVIGNGSGSVGIDSAGNLYVAIGVGDHDNDVIVFDKGSDPEVPTKRLFGNGGNLPTASGLGSPEGVVVSDGQLIVAERGRLLFWNSPASAVNGQPADGYAAGATGFADLNFACCGITVADKSHHLWVTGYLNGDTQVQVDVYQLPLTLGAVPIRTLGFPFDVLGGGQVTLGEIDWPFTGIAVSDAGELWLSHARTNRVLRLRNPLTAPLVDVVLGQVIVDGTLCNQGHGTEGDRQPSPDSLCLPGHVSFDRLGNLFVSDDSLEIQGNLRLLEFSRNLLPSGNTSVIYAPPATEIFADVATWQPAFDSHNHMVIGYNPYGPGPNPLGGWFPGIYGDPLSGQTTPDAYLLDYHSMAYSATFDENDNLYITDLDRSRVLYYDKPTAFLPTILGFAPLNGPTGSAVTITGTNLINTTALRFNGVSATFAVSSDTQLTATVPSSATTGPISLTTPAGGARSLADFGVTVTLPPTITGFAPPGGPVGTPVTITGTSFTGATAVKFNGTAATAFTVNLDTQITATVPSGATTGPISVTTPAGTGASATSFTIGGTPTISSFSPTHGVVGATVTVHGTNFTGATSVTFNGTSASFTVNTTIKITATVPVDATTGKIGVTTPTGPALSASSFTVAPRITGFSPTSGASGASVTITGANFTAATSVRFNGTAATYTVDSGTQIAATVPAAATSGKITVTTSAGTATSATDFTVAPGITTFTPTSGIIGTSVTIKGANFTGATSVRFNGTSATSYAVNTSIKITATVPAGATTGKISVTTSAGTATSTGNFTVKPDILGFTPTSGATGISVTITGTGFTGATSVKFNGTTAGFTVDSSTQITATVPATATTGTISVTTPGGTDTSSTSFTVAPRITSFSPTSGHVGARVAISGANFTGARSVTFNGVAASSFTVNSSIKITATVPPGATTGKVGVSTPAGTATSAGNFTVN